MRKQFLITTILVFAFSFLAGIGQAFSQDKTVSGTVVAEADKKPIAGISVLVKGSSKGVITDDQGKFSISIPSSAAVLVFSSAGYASR